MENDNVFEDNLIEFEDTPREEPKKTGYISQSGFVTKPVLRGFTEIENLFNIVSQHKAFICGGYVRYMASERQDPFPASDVDVYCFDEETFNQLKVVFNNKGLDQKHENEICVTYSRPIDFTNLFFSSPPIQLIKPVKDGAIVARGTMEEILDNFDFTVIRCGLQSKHIALVDADFEHDEQRKILRLKNIHCPISSTLRCCKYSRKGYWLPPTQALRLFFDWDDRSIEYKTELIEFLNKANEGEGLTQEEIDHLERLMRID